MLLNQCHFHYGIRLGHTDDTFTYNQFGESIGYQASTSGYVYDANGNCLNQSTATSNTNGSYDNQDRLLSYGANTYEYTANDELQRKMNPNGETLYQYDELGNLLSVQLPDGNTIEYIIDGLNRRIGKKLNGILEQGLLYQDNLNPVAELDGSGNVVSRFVYASKLNVPDYMIKNGQRYRIISDQLGSPRLVINAQTGAVAQRIDYDEFGNVIADSNPGFQTFGFAGGIADRDNGLVRFGARDYDPATGRWAAKDPIMFEGNDFNLYVYSFGDPINFVDSTGLVGLFGTSVTLNAFKREPNRLPDEFAIQLTEISNNSALAASAGLGLTLAPPFVAGAGGGAVTIGRASCDFAA